MNGEVYRKGFEDKHEGDYLEDILEHISAFYKDLNLTLTKGSNAYSLWRYFIASNSDGGNKW